MTDAVVAAFLAAARERDWPTVSEHLHPYLHWASGRGSLRGRKNVIAMLELGPPPDPPASVELRDGQIYRWRA